MKTDKKQKQDGKVVKFGVKQVHNDTPVFVKWIFRAILYSSGLYALVIQPTLKLPVETQLLIDTWIIVGNNFIHFTTRFFGWDHPEN